MSVRQHLKKGSPFAERLFLGVALSILGGYVGLHLYSGHSLIEDRERERLQNQARLIDQNLERQLAAVNNALVSIRGDLPFLNAPSDGGTQLNHRLQAMSDAMPGVRTLAVFNSEGTIVASNRAELIGQNFREREYFQVARQSRDPAVLHVSPPFKIGLGSFVINLVRVIPDVDGRFAGIVTATLDPGYFSTLLGSVNYASDMWTALGHGDGKLFLMVPERAGMAGQYLAKPGSFFRKHMESGQTATVMTGMVLSTGEERMLAQRTVRPATVSMDKPLVVAVGRDLAALFAPWRRDAYVQGGLFGVLVLLSGVGLYARQKRQRSFARIAAMHEAEQLRSTEQYRTIIQASLDGFWITDPSGRILDANETICRMLGYSREELLHLNISAIEADKSPEKTAGHIREMVETGSVQFEARHRRKDGTIIDVEVSVLYVANLGERFFAFVRDVTERKQADQQLRIAATVFEAQEGMLVTDAGSVILRVNHAFTKITGYSAEEAVGRTPNLLKSDRHDEAFYADMWRSQRSLSAWHGEIWNRRKNGEVYPAWLSITAVKGDAGEITHYVATLTDITQRKAAEDEITHLAFYDPLTRLPNRRLLFDRLQQALATSARSQRNGALLFIDLDNFKALNDTLGHDQGDLLLQQVAQRLATCVRESDTVARLGGDEFVVLLEDLSESLEEAAAQTETVGNKILAAFNQPYLLDGHQHCSTPSIGATLFSNHQNSVDEILKRADLAMYEAKTAGRNTLRFFNLEMQATPRAALEAGQNM